MPYVIEGGYGSFSKKPTKIANTISDWLRDDEFLAGMSSKAKRASRLMVRLSNTSYAPEHPFPLLHNCSQAPQRSLRCQPTGKFWAHRSSYRAISLLQ